MATRVFDRHAAHLTAEQRTDALRSAGFVAEFRRCVAEGAAAERARVQSILSAAAALGADPAEANRVAFETDTPAGTFATQLLQREGAARRNMQDALARSATYNERAAAAERAQAYAREHGVSFVDACKALDITL